MLVNKIIIEKIKSLLNSSIKTKSKSKFVYKKILDELVKMETSIISHTQIRNIPNVGIKIAEMLFAHVENFLASEISNLEDLEKYKLFFKCETYNKIKDDLQDKCKKKEYSDINMTSIDIEITKSFIDDSFVLPLCDKQKTGANLSPLVKKKQIKGLKKYVPGYKTGAYAILKALWLEDGISKHKIIQIAKNYCNTEFDLTSRNSAWSGIKTLLEKDLVYKETGSKKYFITFEGQILANKLFINTSMIECNDFNVTLLIDAREIKNRNFRSFFQSYFENKKISFETRLLEIGDFTWIINEMVCDFIVERKCGSDFVSSIVDGRFKEQKNRLLDTGISHIFYIVENLKPSDFKTISPDCGFQSLTFTKLQGMVVLETDDIKESAYLLECIHSRVKKENEEKVNYKMSYGSFIEKGSKNKNTNVNMMLFYAFYAINGINNEKATKLASHFGTFADFYTIGLKNELKQELSKFDLSKKNVDDIMHFMYKK